MMNGTPIVFRANWFFVLLFAAGAIAFAPLSLLLLRRGGQWLATLVAVFSFSCAVAAMYLPMLVVKVFPEGIVKTGLLGEADMRWDQVEELYFEALQHHEHGIPVHTSYEIRLVDMSGNVVKIPTGLGKARQLATLVTGYVIPLITDRLEQRFNFGERLGFGSIQISRHEGIQAKANAFKRVVTPWSMFAGTKIKAGTLYILRRDQASGGVAAVSRIPNAFALQNLLSRISGGRPPLVEQQVKAALGHVGA
jgi:hypothetical protein